MEDTWGIPELSRLQGRVGPLLEAPHREELVQRGRPPTAGPLWGKASAVHLCRARPSAPFFSAPLSSTADSAAGCTVGRRWGKA